MGVKKAVLKEYLHNGAIFLLQIVGLQVNGLKNTGFFQGQGDLPDFCSL